MNSKAPTEPLKSNLDSSLGGVISSSSLNDISVWQAMGIAKSIFVTGANILVAVLETLLWILKWILGFIPKS